MRNRPFHDLCVAKNLDYSTTVSLYPNPSISLAISGCTNSFMSPTEVARIPMLHDQFQVTTAGTAYTLEVHPSAWYISGVNETQPDFLAIATSGFRFWRGSIKFLLHFVGTPFYSVRVKIIISVNPSAETNLQHGDHPGRILDIKGTTWVEVMVPYIDDQVWRYTNPLYDTSYSTTLYVYVMTDVQGSSAPAAATFYVNLWRAAGEDFQLTWPCDSSVLDGDDGNIFYGDATSEQRRGMNAAAGSKHRISKKKSMRGNSQMDVQEVFKHAFCCTIDNTKFTTEKHFISSEHGYTISDLMKRPQIINDDSYFYTYPDTVEGTPDGYYSRSPMGIWSHCFLVWRGGRRYLLYPNVIGYQGVTVNAPPVQHLTNLNPLNLNFVYGASPPNFIGMGGTGWYDLMSGSNPEANTLSINVPWVTNVPFCYTDSYLGFTPPTTSPATLATKNMTIEQLPFDAWFSGVVPAGQTYMYTGEDFEMLWLTPPIVTIRPTPSRTTSKNSTSHE